MSGFIYKGKSTESVISSSPLMLATFNFSDSMTGSKRENIIGNTTLTRPIPNEYGTQSSALTFEYALVKKTREPFTDEEQIIVETWLSSPKFSSGLQIIDCEGNEVCTYCGKFTSTEWKPCCGGWAGVIFTFENNSAYPKRHFEHTCNVTGSLKFDLNCQSDELEEFVYPVVEIFEPNETATVTIKNITDNNNTMTLRAFQRLPITLDCEHCIPTDKTTNGVISYSDLGWRDVGNIYWLRLYPGINEIEITGNVEMTISYDAPYKKVGGWI